MKIENVVIIGAGPAGIAAALQLKRLGITPIVLERTDIGGLLRNANLVENYPGFPNGISGLELVRLIREQAEHASIAITYDEVVELTYGNGLFQMKTRENLISSRTVVIAPGTKPIQFSEVQVAPDALGYIYYEVHPLRDIVGKQIVIVGAGDAAFDYALSLSRRNQVMILNRSEKIKCLQLLWKKSVVNPSISYRSNIQISGVMRESDDNLALDCRSKEGNFRIYADYLIGALGREPQLDFVPANLREQIEQLQLDDYLHIIGDAKNGTFRQAAIAAGDGVMAGMKIYRRLKEVNS